MAKTYNPLHKFRSYSYHFVLMVSNVKDQLSILDSPDHGEDLDRFLIPEYEDPSKRYDAKTIDNVKYVVLYNSMQSAAFAIDSLDLECTNFTSGSTSALTNYMQMIIKEPLTVDFYAALYQAYCNVNDLDANENVEVNLAAINFGLKILFTGYLDDYHKEGSRIVSNINIIEFMIKNMDMKISNTGATYEILCTPKLNGVAIDPNISNIGGLSTKLSVNLYDALKDLEQSINDRVKNSIGFDKDIKHPTYVIYPDKIYKDPKYKLDLVSNAQLDTYAHAPKTSNDTNDKANETVENNKDKEVEQIIKPILATFKIGDNIKDAINKILGLCSEVSKEKVVDRTDPEQLFNYIPFINSDGSSDDYKIYHIIRTKNPIKLADSSDDSNPSSNPEVLSYPLEWDYIYTGTNKDVINFDMRLNGYLSPSTKYGVMHSNNINDNKDLNDNNKNLLDKNNANHDDLKTGNEKDQEASIYKGQNDEKTSPIFRDNMRYGSGSLNPSLVFGMRKAISASNLMSGLEMSLNIIGNPLLLAGYTKPSDTYISNGKLNDPDTVDKKLQEHKDETGIDPYEIASAKVNVRIPKPSYLQGQIIEEGYDNFYSAKFWYDGLYIITKILSRFHLGKFTQILTLVPNPLNNSIDKASKKAPQPSKDNGEKPQNANQEPVQGDMNNLDAFKAMLAEFESGDGTKGKGYDVMYGGKKFTDFSDHPFRGKHASNTPAGRYQILLGTYDGYKGKAGVSDFSPESQEKICDALITYRKCMDLIVAGKIHTALALQSPKLNKWTNLQNEWEVLRPHKHSKESIISTYKKYGGKVTDDPNGNNDSNSDKSSPNTGTGSGNAQEFINVARGELGYLEGPKNNETKYAKELGFGEDYWCYMFVSWCAKHAGVKIPGGASTANSAAEFKKQNRWINDNPQPGDLVFYHMMGANRINHVGIVVSDDGNSITTIEGNTHGPNSGNQRDGKEVALKHRSKTPSKYHKIVGYGKPNFK